MTGITTHVLDTALGKPAAEVAVSLEHLDGSAWVELARSATDTDGRCRDLLETPPSGRYRLTFETGAYFERSARRSIYPQITIVFECGGDAHYHLPLLLSDNSYTTYRGT